MSIQTSARGRALRFSARGLLLPVLASALLAGCGSSSKNQELEARIAAAEAKAEAADKRSQQALSMAASGSGSSSQFSSEAEVVPDDMSEDNMISDNSGDSGISDSQFEVPAPPPPPG